MMTNIAFVGDIMPGGILHGKSSGVSQEVKDYLASFDFRLGTLECAIGDTPTFDPIKMGLKQDVIYAPNIDLDKLVEIGINVVSLANNHAFDLGEDGLVNTINQLDRLGIKHCGAGRNIEEASTPIILEKNNLKIGFLGYCDYRQETVGYVPIATATTAGMNSLSSDYITQIKNLKKKVDYVYLIVHWGIEHTFWPDQEMLEVAKRCIEAGANGIIGDHQHRIQPLVYYRKTPIFLGLGNFLFPPRFLKPPRPMYYPDDSEDTSRYPVTDSYPWVTQPTFKIWKRLGYIGAIGSISILSNGGQKASMKFIEIKNHTNMVFPISCPLNFREKLEFCIVKNSIPSSGGRLKFSVSRFMFRGIRFMRRRIKAIISKIQMQ